MACVDMDHRWGMRMPVSLDVQLICQAGSIAVGRLADVSVSGAFVRTSVVLRLLSHVRIVLVDRLSSGGRPLELSAYVIRQDASGAGLEWWNLSPGRLQRLFQVGSVAVPRSSVHQGLRAGVCSLHENSRR